MRIIAGEARGRKLATDFKADMRPLMDSVKESLFNILAGTCTQATVLDLYAGTGSFGLEALSRGAERACMVDAGGASVRLIQKNIGLTGFTGKARVVRQKVDLFLASAVGPYDIIFADPPFPLYAESIQSLVAKVCDRGLLAPEGWFITRCFFKDADALTEDRLVMFDRRRYGENCVSFYQTKEHEK